MKGLSIVITILLFVVAIALSDFLKKTGVAPEKEAVATHFDNNSPQARAWLAGDTH